MACNSWYKKARDGRFWLFSDALFGWIKQLEPEELAGDDADALGFFQAMLALQAAPPVQEQAFHDAVCRLDTSRPDRDGWLKVVTQNDTDGCASSSRTPLTPQRTGYRCVAWRSRRRRLWVAPKFPARP